MQRLFGSSSQRQPKPTLSDAITSTESRISAIEVKVKKLDGELLRYKDQMSRLRPGPGKAAIQERAIRVLKQRKMYESQIASLEQQNFNMESAALTTENLRNTMVTVDAMKTANKELKKTYGKVDIDKIESVHYDMEDLLEQANEVQEMLGRSYAVPDEVDEADLQAELDALSEFGAEEEASYLDDVTTKPTYIDTTLLEEHGLHSSLEPARPVAASGS